MTTQQYSKPQVIEVGNAIKVTLGRGIKFRDFFVRGRRLLRSPF